MLCDRCKKNEATIVRQTTVNGVTHTEHLCPECAAKESGDIFGSFFNNDFFNEPSFGGNAISNWFAPFFEGAAVQTPKKQALDPGPCPNCGMSWEAFQKNGLLGCDQCYDHFADRLPELLRRIHGQSTHVGKKPGQSAPAETQAPSQHSKKEDLEEAMKKAVADENFEEAARLRDMIKALSDNDSTSGENGGAPNVDA